MNKIILASHGNLAVGMKSTLEMITGKKANLFAIGMTEDKDPNFVLEEAKRIIAEADFKEKIFIFSDFPGGSVNTALTSLIASENVTLVSGMTTAMLLEFLLVEETEMANMIDKVIETGKDSIKRIELNKFIEQDIWEDD